MIQGDRQEDRGMEGESQEVGFRPILSQPKSSVSANQSSAVPVGSKPISSDIDSEEEPTSLVPGSSTLVDLHQAPDQDRLCSSDHVEQNQIDTESMEIDDGPFSPSSSDSEWENR